MVPFAAMALPGSTAAAPGVRDHVTPATSVVARKAGPPQCGTCAGCVKLKLTAVGHAGAPPLVAAGPGACGGGVAPPARDRYAVVVAPRHRSSVRPPRGVLEESPLENTCISNAIRFLFVKVASRADGKLRLRGRPFFSTGVAPCCCAAMASARSAIALVSGSPEACPGSSQKLSQHTALARDPTRTQAQIFPSMHW